MLPHVINELIWKFVLHLKIIQAKSVQGMILFVLLVNRPMNEGSPMANAIIMPNHSSVTKRYYNF